MIFRMVYGEIFVLVRHTKLELLAIHFLRVSIISLQSAVCLYLAISQLSPVKIYLLYMFPRIALILTPHLTAKK